MSGQFHVRNLFLDRKAVEQLVFLQSVVQHKPIGFVKSMRFFQSKSLLLHSVHNLASLLAARFHFYILLIICLSDAHII